MTILGCKIDATNRILQRPCVHDGTIAELHYAGSTLSLVVANAPRTIRLDLAGVEEANLTLWNGAIVADIFIVRAAEAAANPSEFHRNLWATLFRGQAGDGEVGPLSRRFAARSPDSWLVVVQCAYGEDMACLARTIAASVLDEPEPAR